MRDFPQRIFDSSTPGGKKLVGWESDPYRMASAMA
jgi:hypothetical protein